MSNDSTGIESAEPCFIFLPYVTTILNPGKLIRNLCQKSPVFQLAFYLFESLLQTLIDFRFEKQKIV